MKRQQANGCDWTEIQQLQENEQKTNNKHKNSMLKMQQFDFRLNKYYRRHVNILLGEDNGEKDRKKRTAQAAVKMPSFVKFIILILFV